MRVIKEINLSPTIKGTLFSWNGKYIIKLEKGNLEQTYKISETDITGISDIDSLLSSLEFVLKAEKIFDVMDENVDSVY